MIEISNINKTFNAGSINEVRALIDISLHISKGEFITIIGTNGSGKSTLLNLIAGTIFPDTGYITLNGKNITQKKDFQRAAYIARVFQNPFTGTASGMTIAENLLIAYQRGNTRLPKISLNKYVMEHFKNEVAGLEMQLEYRLDNLIGTLSGGQRQSLTLLMAVLKKPEILLLDEHTAALDPKTAAQIIRLTKKFIEQLKLTAVMVTHSMQQALELGDRTIMMYKGRIIDDINRDEKRKLTTDDLLDKFNDLRKKERLTDELLRQFRNEYI